jgi:lactoylglutathione lyase
MKKILSLFALLFILCISTSIAQKPTLNHIAHYIYDLQKSTAFYTQVIGLDTIPEPFHDGKHTWLSIGNKTHLHLIQGAKNPENHDKNSHICFTVPSVEQFIKRLKDAEVPFEDWAGTSGAVTHRVDGVLQIYFKDPDGYWIEVNDARQ